MVNYSTASHNLPVPIVSFLAAAATMTALALLRSPVPAIANPGLVIEEE